MRQALPSGWEWVPLSRLVSKIEAGKSFKCDERPPSGDEPGIVKVSAVTWGRYEEGESKTITDLDRVNPAYLIRPGDFLFSRANTLQLVGACVVVHATAKQLLLSDKILRLVMPEALKPWVLWFLRSAEGRRRIEALSTGNQESMRNIGQERIGQIEVPLPPADSLQRIVSRIEELFSEIDEGERALERVGQLVERYRQSVLKAAVTGELTRGESIAGELPEGWLLRSLPELSAEKPTNGISVKGSDSPPGVAALRLDAITETGFDFTARRFIPINADKAEKLAIRAGDFFASRANGSLQLVGRGVLASEPPCQTVFPDTMIRYRLGRSEALNRWVALAWSSGFVRRQIEAKAKTTAGIYKISQGDISEIVFPVPPTEAEMLQVVDAVARQSGAWRRVLAEQRDRAREATALRQSILKAAFSGQLVPQDLRDEPAWALLARLAAQAADTPAAPRRRGRPAGLRSSQPNPEVAD
jgi:type I restriction enzyme, S subunit